jgi:hypothetical protein
MSGAIGALLLACNQPPQQDVSGNVTVGNTGGAGYGFEGGGSGWGAISEPLYSGVGILGVHVALGYALLVHMAGTRAQNFFNSITVHDGSGNQTFNTASATDHYTESIGGVPVTTWRWSGTNVWDAADNGASRAFSIDALP